MVFTVLGAVAELERSLIAERVRAGLRNAERRENAWADLQTISIPKISALRAQGLSLRAIAKALKVGVGTLYRIAPERSKIQEKAFGTL